MIHHAATFIQNTLKPVIKEFDKCLEECEHLNIRGKEIEKWLESAIGVWFAIELVKSLTFIIMGGMFCWTVYLILR